MPWLKIALQRREIKTLHMCGILKRIFWFLGSLHCISVPRQCYNLSSTDHRRQIDNHIDAATPRSHSFALWDKVITETLYFHFIGDYIVVSLYWTCVAQLVSCIIIQRTILYCLLCTCFLFELLKFVDCLIEKDMKMSEIHKDNWRIYIAHWYGRVSVDFRCEIDTSEWRETMFTSWFNDI